MKKANTWHELVKSIKNGRFTLDGGHLKSSDLPDDMYLENLGLTSLIGCPKTTNYDFICADNNLDNLDGGPTTMGHLTAFYYCSNNNLHSLHGAPEKVHTFNCNDNSLHNLEYAPRYVESDFYCANNYLVSLHNVHKIFDYIGHHFYASSNPGRPQISKAILGLLLIPKLEQVTILPTDGFQQTGKIVNDIINDCITSPTPNKTLLYKCAQDLIKAGYPELAKL